MDWKKAAEDDLKLYNLRMLSLDNISERIATLKASKEGVKACVTDKVPVKGGQSKYEEMLINCIVEIERLSLNYEVTERLIKLTERGLSVLDDEEREVLESFYISGSERCLDVLRERLGYEKSQIYRIKDRALQKYTVACFGVTQL